MTKQVNIRFGEKTINQLKALMERHDLGTITATMKYALNNAANLDYQADQGYTEIVVRNPTTGAERVLIDR